MKKVFFICVQSFVLTVFKQQEDFVEQSNAEMLGSVSAVGREAVIVQPLEDVVVREGKIATFLAQIAPSNLSVEWYHNGVPILPNEQIKIYRDGGCSTLVINKVKLEDAGLYTIRICNTEVRSAAKLIVTL